MKLSSNFGKIKRTTRRGAIATLLTLAAAMLCYAFLSFTGMFGGVNGANVAQASNVGTAITLDPGSDESGDFSASGAEKLFKAIGGSEVTSYTDLKSALGSGTMDAQAINTDVILGGYRWHVVYASKDTSGDVIATLWLADVATDSSCLVNEQDGNGNWGRSSFSISTNTGWKWEDVDNAVYPCAMYSSSKVRRLIAGSGEAATSATATSTVSQTSNCASFISKYGAYMDTPSQVSWQLSQDRKSIFGEYHNYPNDSAAAPSGWSYSWYDTKMDYTGAGKSSNGTTYYAWANDRLWLPSACECQDGGIWNTSAEQRTGERDNFVWLRSGHRNSSNSVNNLNLEGVLVNTTAPAPWLVQPAFHLNLKSVLLIPISPEPEANEVDYTGSAQSLLKNFDSSKMTVTYKYTPFVAVSGSITAVTTATSTTSVSFTNAGKYEFTLTPKDGYCWEDDSATKTYTSYIYKKAATVKWTGVSESTTNYAYTYSGSAQGPTAAITNGPSTTVSSTYYTLSNMTNTNASTSAYTAKISMKGAYANNYYFSTNTNGSSTENNKKDSSGTSSVSRTYNINKADLTVSLSYGTVTYGSDSDAPTLTVKRGSTTITSGYGKVTYSIASGDQGQSTGYTGKGTVDGSTGSLTPVQAGKIRVTVSIAANTNYNDKTATADVTINKADLTLSLSYGTVTYGSDSDAPTLTVKRGSTTISSGYGKVTYSIANGDQGQSTGYTGKGTVDGSSGSLTPEQAGKIRVTVSIADSTNYNGETATADVTINKADLTLSLSYGTVTYGGSAVTPTFTVKSGSTTLTSGYGAVTYSIATGDQGQSTGYTGKGTVDGSTGSLTPEQAGKIRVTVTIADSTNYNGETATADVTINKAELYVSLSYGTVTYGSDSDAPTLTVKHGSESGDDITVPATPVYSLSAALGYGTETTINSSTGVITPKAAGQITVVVEIPASTNYNEASAECNVTIGRLSIARPETHNSLELVYSGSAQQLFSGWDSEKMSGTYTYEPFVADSGITGVSGENMTTDQYTDAGNYAFTITPGDNYQWDSGENVTGTTVVNVQLLKKGYKVAFEDKNTFTYNGMPQGPGVAIAMGGPHNSMENLLEYYDIKDTTATDVGEYTAEFQLKGVYGNNYYFKADLDDLVNDKRSVAYRASEGEPVGSDGESISATASKITKNYTITALSVTDSSVTFSFESLTYNGSAQTPAPTVKFKTSAMSAEVTLAKDTDYTYADSDFSDNVNASADNGKLVITGTGNFKDERTLTFGIEQFSITGASVTLEDGTLTYSGAEQKKAATVKVTLNGVEITLGSDDYNVAYANSNGGEGNTVNVGTITVTVTGKGNFKDSATAKPTYEIGKAQVSVSKFIIDGTAVSADGTTVFAFDGNNHYPAAYFTFNGTDYVIPTANVVVKAGSESGETVTQAIEINSYYITVTANNDEYDYFDILASENAYAYRIGRVNPNLVINIDNAITYGESQVATLEGNLGNAQITWTITTVDGRASFSASGMLTKTLENSPKVYATGVGKIKLKAAVEKTTLYEASETEIEVTVETAPIKPVIEYSEMTYGKAQAASVSGNLGGGEVTWTIECGTGKATFEDGKQTLTTTGATPTIYATGAGEITLKANVAANGNYAAGKAEDVVITIARAAISLKITVEKSEMTYGELQRLSLGGNFGDGEVTWTIECGTGKATFENGRETLTTTGATPEIYATGAGDIALKATVALTENYAAGEAQANITIIANEISIEWVGTSFNYDGAPHLPTLKIKCTSGEEYTLSEITLNQAMPVTLAGGDVINVTVKPVSGGTSDMTSAGVYGLSVAVDNPNYAVKSGTQSVTVTIKSDKPDNSGETTKSEGMPAWCIAVICVICVAAVGIAGTIIAIALKKRNKRLH